MGALFCTTGTEGPFAASCTRSNSSQGSPSLPGRGDPTHWSTSRSDGLFRPEPQLSTPPVVVPAVDPKPAATPFRGEGHAKPTFFHEELGLLLRRLADDDGEDGLPDFAKLDLCP
ncbi:hypothetical protein HPB47_002740 [Ixodes persulcatus]|uniref:Uncharacterized protein n=1 Tax=Ixodes persulcatus TaxID=34615 RepID=A0AC60PLC2_IXOPE|nr:hypothetical protein HPB47_002740 [Ixodes persulcatus]